MSLWFGVLLSTRFGNCALEVFAVGQLQEGLSRACTWWHVEMEIFMLGSVHGGMQVLHEVCIGPYGG